MSLSSSVGVPGASEAPIRPEASPGSSLKAYPLLIATALFWGGNAVAGRLAIGEISPMALTCLRWAIVALLLSGAAQRQLRAAWPVLRPRWRRIVVTSTAGFTGFNALFYVAAHYTTAVNLAIIQGSIPVLVLLGALAFQNTRVTLLQVCGMAATLAGVAVVAAKGDLSSLASLRVNFGDGLMVIACLLYATYTILLRDRPAVPGLPFFAAMACVAFLTSLPLLASEIVSGTVIWPHGRGWLIMLFVALFPSFLAQIFYIRGVELIGPARAGLFINLVPVFGPTLAVMILGEPFGLYHAVALALVLGGIFLAETGRRRTDGTAIP